MVEIRKISWPDVFSGVTKGGGAGGPGDQGVNIQIFLSGGHSDEFGYDLRNLGERIRVSYKKRV